MNNSTHDMVDIFGRSCDVFKTFFSERISSHNDDRLGR